MADDKTETPGWSQPEYSPGANPHNDGTDDPPGLAPVVQEIPTPPGAETGHKATDTGGAASGAGAGSKADKSDLSYKGDLAESVTGQPAAGTTEGGTSDSSGGSGGGKTSGPATAAGGSRKAPGKTGSSS